MTSVYDIADEIRERLLDGDVALLAELKTRYEEIAAHCDLAIQRLDEKIAAAAAAGEPLSGTWMRERLAELRDQLTTILTGFGSEAAALITTAQQLVLDESLFNNERLIRAALGPPPSAAVAFTFNRLPLAAINELVGFLSDGSPLKNYFDDAAGLFAREVEGLYLSGLAQGLNPRVIAAQTRQLLNVPLHRAQTTARTATFNVQREAQRRVYQANKDVVKGWRWHSALTTRTCAICWALHGSFHELDERFESHHNCRCSAVPVTRTWAELGFPNVADVTPPVIFGADAFAKLTRADQLEILGPGKLELYEAGQLRLADLIGKREDPIWGSMRYELPLKVVANGSSR